MVLLGPPVQRCDRALEVEVGEFVLLDDRWLYCCNLMQSCDVGQYEGGQFGAIYVVDINEEGAEFCIDGLVGLKEQWVVDNLFGDGEPAHVGKLMEIRR